MARNHVFIASGDACGICEAYNASIVEEGFRPHDNCNCNTTARDDGEGDCEYDYDVSSTFPSGPRTRAYLSLTITCPDGTVHDLGDFIAIDLGGLTDGEGGYDELLEALAGDECEHLCPEEAPFLCC